MLGMSTAERVKAFGDLIMYEHRNGKTTRGVKKIQAYLRYYEKRKLLTAECIADIRTLLDSEKAKAEELWLQLQEKYKEEE